MDVADRDHCRLLLQDRDGLGVGGDAGIHRRRGVDCRGHVVDQRRVVQHPRIDVGDAGGVVDGRPSPRLLISALERVCSGVIVLALTAPSKLGTLCRLTEMPLQTSTAGLMPCACASIAGVVQAHQLKGAMARETATFAANI